MKRIEAVTVDLPYPPSANRLWRFVPGKETPLKSRDYRAWLSESAMLVRIAARSGIVDGPYALTIQAGRPDNRKRDLDNIIKPLSDALREGGAIRDDSDCQKINAGWVTGLAEVRVMVMSTTKVAA